MSDDALAEQVLADLVASGATVAVAESLTGGLVLASLTSIPGASGHVMGGVVSYSISVKEHVLGVDGELLRRCGSVNRHVAEQMAEQVASLCGADIGLATTGVAGPGDQDGVPAGTYWVAVSAAGHTQAEFHRTAGTRNEVRHAAVLAVLDLLAAVIDSDRVNTSD